MSMPPDDTSLWLLSDGPPIHYACGPFDRICALGERYRRAGVATYCTSPCCRAFPEKRRCDFDHAQPPNADLVLGLTLKRVEGR